MTNLIYKTIKYFKESWAELKKVNWPTRQETIKHSLAVIGLSAIVGLFLTGTDSIFKIMVRLIINR
ncbi:MAG: preprotein translocase subunit SecE [Candidatus Parcubacteria bacterium]|nr:preprotein translocase subunit SecE [Candidatus Parcubacteria bacterium]